MWLAALDMGALSQALSSIVAALIVVVGGHVWRTNGRHKHHGDDDADKD